MASYDNEIYRGPPEAGPTLEHDIRSYGSDVYIVTAEKNTLAQDVPPTEEPVRQEAKPVQKKESKIAKAMKLLASCTAAVAVAATLSAPAPSDLSEWPRFGQVEMDIGYSFRTISDHSHICQVSVSGRTYRFEALQKDLHMAWHESYNYEEDGSRGGFYMHMNNLQENWHIILDISLTPQDREEPTEALGTIKAKNGDTLYIRSFFLSGDDSPPELLQSIIDNLSSYVRITDARDDGWGKVFIGDTILSDINPEWNGRMSIGTHSWSINRIHYASDHGFDPADSQVQREMNGITWSFFYAPDDDGDPCLWMVPSHEDLALGITSYQIFHELGVSHEMMEENPDFILQMLPDVADIVIDQFLCYYHLADVDIDPSDWGNATQPTEDFLDSSKYFHAAEFSLGQRSFRMDSMRDDVSIRHFYTGPAESEEFDLLFAGDDTHVKLVLSTDPDGKEFYEYSYPGFAPVYYALYSWSDHPMSADELDTLAYDIPNCINLTELTVTPETTVPSTTMPSVTEPVLPDPYPEMEEYLQYSVNYNFGLQHTEFARSNRVCQFVTQYGAYRLQALEPELFINWEDYYYDIKEDSANSLVTFSHYEEGWKLGAWVFEEQVDSIYQSFSLRTDSGKELWFYADPNNSNVPETEFVAVIDRIFQLATLSEAQEDGWGKVRIGQTLISHNSASWNGFAYTSGSDYWYFEQILDSHALSGYDLQHAGQRVVNGITWDFYTLGGPSGYPNSDGIDYYFTQVYVVCGQEDLWLKTSLSYGLSPSNSQFASQEAYEANLDKEMAVAINTIVRDGLSNYYSYP